MSTVSLQRLFLGLVVLTPVLVSSQLTIPRRSLGFVYKTSNANRSSLVTLTAYMDLTCDDSLNAYPILLEVADHFAGKNFELVMRSFPLPYHRNSHIITQMVHVVNDVSGGANVYPFLTEIFANLNYLTTYATHDKTDKQVFDILTPIVTKASGISVDVLEDELLNVKYDLASRLDFKYGCTRGVYGTPTFMVNDVVVEADPKTPVKDWVNLIEPLL